MLLLLTAMSSADAKDLGNRIGVGFNNQLGALPAISARYGLPSKNPAINIQIEADLGLNIVSGGDTAVLIGGRALYAVVVEDNMNLYAFGGGTLTTVADTATVRIQPGLEIQAFPFGLENLGINAGFGLNLDLGSEAGVSTNGALLSGVHYWF
jgi:hypothetical protein